MVESIGLSEFLVIWFPSKELLSAGIRSCVVSAGELKRREPPSRMRSRFLRTAVTYYCVNQDRTPIYACVICVLMYW